MYFGQKNFRRLNIFGQSLNDLFGLVDFVLVEVVLLRRFDEFRS